MLVDPVCGKRVKRQRAHIAIDYGGVTYYLCCPRCQAEFEREPYKFARQEWGEKSKVQLSQNKFARHGDEFRHRMNLVQGKHE